LSAWPPSQIHCLCCASACHRKRQLVRVQPLRHIRKDLLAAAVQPAAVGAHLPSNPIHSNTSNRFRATMEYHCCDAMYRAIGNCHFLYTGFIPEVVRAGMDRIPSEDAHPEVVLPTTRELMARRAAERGDGNLWAKEFHYPHQDLFVPADFPSSNHAFTVWDSGLSTEGPI